MRALTTVLLVTLASLAASCTGTSPEQQVARLIDEVEGHVEQGSLRALAARVSDAYSDDGGRDKRAALGLLAYAVRGRTVHLFKRIAELEVAERGRVEVTVFVAVAAEPVGGADDLRDVEADLLRFDAVVLEEEGGVWRVASARWRSAGLTDFF